MSETATAPAPPAEKKKRSRAFDLIIVTLIMAAVVACAFYQEQIGAMFRLRLWDKGAPGRVIEQYLRAAKKGDEQGAAKFVKSTSLMPMKKGGKWTGYTMQVMSAKMEIPLEDLIPKTEPDVTLVEINNAGNGSAVVAAPNTAGHSVKYRLEMKDGEWKITDIRAGRPVQQEARPGGGPGKKPG